MAPSHPTFLGELELAVMDHVWSHGPCDVKACHLAVGGRRKITSNTVQSTLERLYRKGLLRRQKVSHAFVYEAALTREAYGARMAEHVVSTVVGTAAPAAVLAAFVDLADRAGEENLARLERLLLLAATTAVGFGFLAALLAAVAYPVVRSHHARLPAASRARLIAAWSAAPWLVGGLLVALCFLPSMWSVLGIVADHCPLHDDGHVHLCLEHAPHGPVSLVEWLLLGAAATGAGIVFARVVAAQFTTWRAVVALVRTSGKTEGGLIPSSAPLSVTTGLFRPLVLVSTGLRERLRPEVLAVVLEHERAHARRRDPLRLVAAALLSAGHLPGTRRLLLCDLALACEQAADDEAATATGSGWRKPS